MSEPVSIPEDGFVAFKIGDTERPVDLYFAKNRLLEIRAAVDDELPDAPAAGRANAFQARVVALLSDLGFSGASQRAADKFVTAVFDAADALGKVDAAAPTQD